MSNGAPPKLLVISYACAPGKGSEWGTGWNFVRELARTQDVYLITHDDNRADIENHLPTLVDRDRIHVRYVKLPSMFAWMRQSAYALLNIHYYLWQKAAAREAIQWHGEERFEIVQHVSYTRWWMPSAGAALVPHGAKFIFGTVVGGDLMPPKFRRGVNLRALWGEWLRWLARETWRRDPTLKRCIRSASIVLCGTQSTYDAVMSFKPQRAILISSGNMSDESILAPARAARKQHLESVAQNGNKPFRVVGVGGVSYYRGIDLVLRAIARSGIPNIEYVHACDGPDRPRLEKLARDLGISDRVCFLGDAPHAQNVRTLATADVYAHCVLRDSMGTTPEAMALGIPVLTLDINTPGLMVDDTCGYKVPVTDHTEPEQVIEELARTLRLWHADPELRARLGAGGQSRCHQFSHQGRGEQWRAFHRLAIGTDPSVALPAAIVNPRNVARSA